MKNTRMMWVDSLKGFLMLLVIWSHSKAYIDPPGYFLTAGYMGVFFFLTGYTTTKWDEEGKKYIQKKASRLLIPYCVYGACMVVYQIIISMFKGTMNWYALFSGIQGFLYNAYTFDKLEKVYFLKWDNGPFWFLTAMFLACIYAWIFFYLWNKEKRKIAVITLIAMSLVMNYESRYMLMWGLDSAFIGACLIVLGFWGRRYLFENQWIINHPIFCSSVLSFLLFILTRYKGINMAVKEYGQIEMIGVIVFVLISVISAILGIIIFRICKEKSFIMKFLASVGSNTITLLCTQMFVIRVSNKVMSRLTDNMILVGWISIVMTLLCGYLLSSCIKKIASKKIKWLKYL